MDEWDYGDGEELIAQRSLPVVQAWARMFERAGWDAEYRRGGNTPDSRPPSFLIHGRQPCVAILHSQVRYLGPMRHAARMLASLAGDWSPHIVLLADGPLDVGPGDAVAPGPGYYVAGSSCWGNSPSLLNWHTCEPERKWCGQLAWHNTMDSFQSITCGHHDGDGHLNFADVDVIMRMWNYKERDPFPRKCPPETSQGPSVDDLLDEACANQRDLS